MSPYFSDAELGKQHSIFSKIWYKQIPRTLGYVGVLGYDSWWGLGIFLFTTVSRTALRPTQPPVQWVPGGSSPGGKVAGV